MDLNQITVYASDVAVSAEFYKKLGLRLIVDSIPHYARFECPSGDSTFSLHETDDPPADSKVVLYFECEDLDGVVLEFMEAGIRFEEEPADKNWLWREALLRDPDGNRIILYHAGENRKNPPWRIGS